MYNYKGFFSQLIKALCLSEIVTEAPFPRIGPPFPHVQFPLVMFRTPHNLSKIVTEAPFLSTGSRTLPSSCTILLAMLRAPSNFIKPGPRQLS